MEKNKHLEEKKILNGFKFANDAAESGIKLIRDFSSCLTKHKEQKQFLLKVVSEYRQTFPDSSKATLSKLLPSNCDNYNG